MSGGSPPPAPDPYTTARAQSAMNKETAVSQAELNMVNQVTPYGNLNYNPIGKSADGNPRYEAVTTLSPEQQRLFDIGTETQGNIATIGRDQSQRIGSILGTPFNIDAARGTKLSDIERTFLDPQFARERESLESNLLNRGIRPGTEAYTRAQQEFEDNKARAYNRMYLDSYGQTNQAALTERNQPINEITALMSGSQVAQPNFVSTPQTNIQPTDLSGNVYNSANLNQQGWAQKAANQNAMIGNIIKGVGSVAGGFMMSDRRVKENVKRVGETDSGLPIYTYKYKWGGPTQMGVMAQDVLEENPDAVKPIGDILAVNYDKVS